MIIMIIMIIQLYWLPIAYLHLCTCLCVYQAPCKAKPPKPAEKNGEMVYNHLTFSNLVLVHEAWQ